VTIRAVPLFTGKRPSPSGASDRKETKLPVCTRGDRRAPTLDRVLELMSYSLPRGGWSPGPQFGNATPEVAFNGLRVRQGRRQLPSVTRAKSILDPLQRDDSAQWLTATAGRRGGSPRCLPLRQSSRSLGECTPHSEIQGPPNSGITAVAARCWISLHCCWKETHRDEDPDDADKRN
jgi:hypothetical protein